MSAVAGGVTHSLAVKVDGASGHGAGTDSHWATTARAIAPRRVQAAGMSGAAAVAAGGGHSLALKADGTLRAWGKNLNGQLGDGTTVDRATPVAVAGLRNVVAIAAGSGYSLALTADRASVEEMGQGAALGHGVARDSHVPAPNPSCGASPESARGSGTQWRWCAVAASSPGAATPQQQLAIARAAGSALPLRVGDPLAGSPAAIWSSNSSTRRYATARARGHGPLLHSRYRGRSGQHRQRWRSAGWARTGRTFRA